MVQFCKNCRRGQPARYSACLVQAAANLKHMFHRRSLDGSLTRRRKRALISASQTVSTWDNTHTERDLMLIAHSIHSQNLWSFPFTAFQSAS